VFQYHRYREKKQNHSKNRISEFEKLPIKMFHARTFPKLNGTFSNLKNIERNNLFSFHRIITGEFLHILTLSSIITYWGTKRRFLTKGQNLEKYALEKTCSDLPNI